MKRKFLGIRLPWLIFTLVLPLASMVLVSAASVEAGSG